jgi:membrane protein DedA with SNARE-associated domain
MHIGYLGIIIFMVVSPLPPEVFMPLAGFMVAQKELNFVAVVGVGVLGFLLSILPWYVAGRYLGEQGLKRLLYRHRRWLSLSTEKLETANRWFQRYGGQAVFFSLLLPGIRNIISIPAGLSGMPLASFLFYSILSASFWLFLLTYAGYVLGSRYYLVHEYLGPASHIVLFILALAILVWAVGRYFKRRTKRQKQ